VGDTGCAPVGAVLQLGLLLPLQKKTAALQSNRVSFVFAVLAICIKGIGN